MIELVVLGLAAAAQWKAARSRRAWTLRSVSQYERPPLSAFPPEMGSIALVAFENINDPNVRLNARVQVVEEPISSKRTTTGLMLDDVGLEFPKTTFIEFQANNVLQLSRPAVR